MLPFMPHTDPSSPSCESSSSHPSLIPQSLPAANSPPQPQRPSLTRLNSDHASPLTSIYPTPRPCSLPVSSSFSVPISSPPTSTTTEQDPLQRYSSASLPLPHQIPFHALPMSSTPMGLFIPPSPSSNDLSSSAHPSESRSAIRSLCLDEICSSSSSSSSASTSTATSSSSKTSSLEAAPCSPTKPSPSLPSPPTVSSSNASSTQPQRSISPFRAPQPPPPSTQSSRFQSSDFATAMRRFMSPSHTSNPSPSPSEQDHNQSSSSYPPPPDPPVILPAEPSDDTTQPASSGTRSHAPYMPFLSHAPPPPDCWIEVETTLAEYRLNVRLPGFSREGITLATKRRRILHVVADSWENGGGHFERRISFGYDADLIQVRAEFDGVMLRIFVPRRISPVNWYSPRPGPIGRA